MSLCFVGICLLVFFVFPLEEPFAYVLFFMGLICLVLYILRIDPPFPRLITLVVATSLLINSVLNMHFYPRLLKYQAGSEMAHIILDRGIDVNQVYKWSDNHSWALDFYTRRPVPQLPADFAPATSPCWLYVSEKEKNPPR